MNADDTAVIADMERDAKRYRWLLSQLYSKGRIDLYVLPDGSDDWGASTQILHPTQLSAFVDDHIAAKARK